MMETCEEYVARVVAAAPPISDETLDLLAVIFAPAIRPGQDPHARREPSAAELERQRKAQEREDAKTAAKKLALSMTACDVCDLQPDVHEFQQKHGTYHEWEPGRAEKIMGGSARG